MTLKGRRITCLVTTCWLRKEAGEQLMQISIVHIDQLFIVVLTPRIKANFQESKHF